MPKLHCFSVHRGVCLKEQFKIHGDQNQDEWLTSAPLQSPTHASVSTSSSPHMSAVTPEFFSERLLSLTPLPHGLEQSDQSDHWLVAHFSISVRGDWQINYYLMSYNITFANILFCHKNAREKIHASYIPLRLMCWPKETYASKFWNPMLVNLGNLR